MTDALGRSERALSIAMGTYSQLNKRIVEEISVVDSFNEDSKEAMKKYIQLHRANKERELYVVHTSRDHLDIQEKIWTGIRANQ